MTNQGEQIVKTAQGYAVQTLVHTPSGHERVRRTAMCPTHTRQSSDFRGVNNGTWMFHCREKNGHPFYAHPDRQAPKTLAEIPAWEEKQRLGLIEKISSRGQG